MLISKIFFCGNYKTHLQFMSAKIYQILRHENSYNDKVIRDMIQDVKDEEFIHIINRSFEFICKKIAEEKIGNVICIEENEDIGIKVLKQIEE